ncbi:hypothetical protein HGP28_02720 [Vibrio sp. SM6]|uniref:Uncharacterized protein n=1 Tax=Vibrio agarilyticus TaxID=2726741 RepID=A0A7X8TN34_9VIBR|nr:hypothetical protein [Vibrio agarilyticus]NLS11802.1 hypothetical protein [Vibrio agarilyticus]
MPNYDFTLILIASNFIYLFVSSIFIFSVIIEDDINYGDNEKIIDNDDSRFSLEYNSDVITKIKSMNTINDEVKNGIIDVSFYLNELKFHANEQSQLNSIIHFNEGIKQDIINIGNELDYIKFRLLNEEDMSKDFDMMTSHISKTCSSIMFISTLIERVLDDIDDHQDKVFFLNQNRP